MPRFKLDATPVSVVATCTDCRTWIELRATRAEAWKAAREHEQTAHPNAKEASTALWYHSKLGVS